MVNAVERDTDGNVYTGSVGQYSVTLSSTPTGEVTTRSVGQYGTNLKELEDINSAMSWAELAKKWAIDLDLVIDDYSSGYSAKEWAMSGDDLVDPITGITEHSSLWWSSESERHSDEAFLYKLDAEDSAVAAEEAATEVEGIVSNLEDVENAIRNRGTFTPTGGSYPTPILQYLPQVWYADQDYSGSVIWSEGDMLSYVPDATDPENILGTYYRIAGELAAGGAPQPVEILDDLIMQQGKKIRFRSDPVTDITAVSLDMNGDLLIGDVIGDPGEVTVRLGLAATDEVLVVKEMTELGDPTLVHPVLYGPATIGIGEGTGVDTFSDQEIEGVKAFSEMPILPVDKALVDESGNDRIMFVNDSTTIISGGSDVDALLGVVNKSGVTKIEVLADGNITTVATASDPSHLTRKDYVDQEVADTVSYIDQIISGNLYVGEPV